MYHHSTKLSKGVSKPKAAAGLLSMALAYAATTANAASFDCKLASTYSEKAICANSQISKLDDQLSAIYKASMPISDTPDFLKAQQREWIKKRNACPDEACIIALHQSRISDLRRVIAGEPRVSPEILPQNKTNTVNDPLPISLKELEENTDRLNTPKETTPPIAEKKPSQRREKIDLLSAGIKPSEQFITGLWECTFGKYQVKSLERYGPGDYYEAQDLQGKADYVGTYRISPDGQYIEKRFRSIDIPTIIESKSALSMPTNRDLFMLGEFGRSLCVFIDEH